MAERNFRPLPLDSGIRQDIDTDIYGGVSVAHDVDLKSQPGKLNARKADSFDINAPGPTHNIICDLAIKNRFGSSEKTYAILTRATQSLDSNITGFGVRGFANIDGSIQDSDPNENGWHFPPEAQPRSQTIKGNIEHNGREVRLHTRYPKWYGLPRSITENTIDFRYTRTNVETPVLVEPSDEEFSITGPFGDTNVLNAPSPEHLEIIKVERFGQDFVNNRIFGDITLGDPARFRYLYFAASYLFDGYQETPLGLLNAIEIRGQGTDWIDGDPDTWASISVDIKLKGISYGEEGGSETVRSISKRARKIRLYCFPSPVKSIDPLSSGDWYLANEIDVSKWDSKNKAVRWSLPCTLGPASIYHIANRTGVRVDVNVAWVPGSGNVLVPESPNIYTWETFLSGYPYMKLGDDDTEFPIQHISIWNGRTEDQNQRFVQFFTTEAMTEQLERVLGRLGNNAFVRVYHSFRNSDYHPFHRTYIGDELLLRPTYSQLSGISQSETFVSPGRSGGYIGYDVPVIWGIWDKDGFYHANRMMTPDSSPAGLTEDRFSQLNYNDFPFEIVRAIRSGPYLAVMGRSQIDFGILRSDDLAWEFATGVSGVGLVSYRSLAETPYGVAFLASDGIRLLASNEVSQVISSQIWSDLENLKDYFSTSVGFYSPRYNSYIIQIVDPDSTSFNAYMYDFDVKQWVTLSLGLIIINDVVGDIITAADVDPDGYGEYCTLSGGSGRVLCKFGGANYNVDTAAYTINAVFDDPVFEKILKYIKLHFTDAEQLTPSSPTFGIVITSDAGTNPTDSGNNSQTPTLTSGVPSSNIAMHARRFTFEITGFDSLSAFFADVDNLGVRA